MVVCGNCYLSLSFLLNVSTFSIFVSLLLKNTLILKINFRKYSNSKNYFLKDNFNRKVHLFRLQYHNSHILSQVSSSFTHKPQLCGWTNSQLTQMCSQIHFRSISLPNWSPKFPLSFLSIGQTLLSLLKSRNEWIHGIVQRYIGTLSDIIQVMNINSGVFGKGRLSQKQNFLF